MGFKRVGGVTDDLLGVVRERKALGGIDVIGIPTGFHLLDNWMGGLQKDALYLIGGTTGAGKSAFALTMALNIARAGNVVLYFSLEMGARSIGTRLLSQMTGVAKDDIIKGKLKDDELERVVAASNELAEVPLMISDRAYSSLGLCEDAVRYHTEIHPVDAVFVDYMGLLTDGGEHGEHERITKVSSRLRNLARPEQLDCPVVALVQLIKAVEQRDDKRPTLGDIRDSGSPSQDAHAVLMVYRPQHYESSQGPVVEEDAEIIIRKNREGIVGTMRAEFVPERTLWRQPPPPPKPETYRKPTVLHAGARSDSLAARVLARA